MNNDNDNESWKPKLGEKLGKLPEREPHELTALRKVGFAPSTQKPLQKRHKNVEGNPNTPFSGETTMDNQTVSTQSAPHSAVPSNSQNHPMGALPITVTMAPAPQQDFGQDLARFSAKAAVLVLLSAGASIAVHFITKPATDFG